MDFAPVLRAIEAEIEKLEKVRAIVAGLARPSHILRQTLALQTLPAPVAAAIEPRLTVVPPRRKREYRARTRTFAKEQGALTAAPSTRPVFVPRTAVVAPAQPAPLADAMTPEQMEAAVRQKFLGGAA